MKGIEAAPDKWMLLVKLTTIDRVKGDSCYRIQKVWMLRNVKCAEVVQCLGLSLLVFLSVFLTDPGVLFLDDIVSQPQL